MYRMMQEMTLFALFFLVYCPITIMREKQSTFSTSPEDYFLFAFCASVESSAL